MSLKDMVGREDPEPEQVVEETPKAEPKWRSIGVTLQKDEIQELAQISADLDATRNSIMRYAVVKFLKEYREGLIELEFEPRKAKRIRMPEE